VREALRSVLIVEDDDGICDLLHNAFEDAGCVVYAADTPAEAAAALAALGDPCLILLDPLVPQVAAGAFSQVLREGDLLVTIPVVVVAASGSKRPPTVPTRFDKRLMDVDVLLEIASEYFDELAARGCARAWWQARFPPVRIAA
jgi:CheY-like chemotaxis protein